MVIRPTTFGETWRQLLHLFRQRAITMNGAYSMKDIRRGQKKESYGGNQVLVYLLPGDFVQGQDGRALATRATCTAFISRTSKDGGLHALTLAVEDAYRFLNHIGEQREDITISTEPVLPEMEEMEFAMVSIEFSLPITFDE